MDPTIPPAVRPIAFELLALTEEQQRRVCLAMLMLCGLYSEAQAALDAAVRNQEALATRKAGQ